ncbi:MAG TPA: hypothetical protein VF919_12950, partial [Gemmatimonadales bacterium]
EKNSHAQRVARRARHHRQGRLLRHGGCAERRSSEIGLGILIVGWSVPASEAALTIPEGAERVEVPRDTSDEECTDLCTAVPTQAGVRQPALAGLSNPADACHPAIEKDRRADSPR